MSDTENMKTDDLILHLDRIAFEWGVAEMDRKNFPDCESVQARPADMRTDVYATRDELRNRLAEQKRAIDAGLEREAGLRRERFDLRERAESAEGVLNDVIRQKNTYIEQYREAYHRAESAEARVKSLEQELAIPESRAGGFAQEREDLRAEVERLKKEAAHWAAKAGRYSALATQPPPARTAVPRVIRPDEIQVGQKIAWTGWESGDWHIQTATTNGGAFAPGYPGTIVLLADAPEDADEEEPERRGDLRARSCLIINDVVDVWGEDGKPLATGITFDGDRSKIPDGECYLVERPGEKVHFKMLKKGDRILAVQTTIGDRHEFRDVITSFDDNEDPVGKKHAYGRFSDWTEIRLIDRPGVTDRAPTPTPNF